ncbi:MAG: hypothetical protein JNK14_06750 [Chitinophagaceae bacterium]|nr:hypothetical protein [Chitinophagaceae bacterium]
MNDTHGILWKPLLEAAAQTIVGAIGSYTFAKIVSKVYEKNSFEGPMDFWKRGIMNNNLGDGDTVHIDALISPYSQLFPGNPFYNAKRWNTLYCFPGAITSSEYQALEFFSGSDAALRIGSLNGETIVGLYHRYGFVGEGLIGVAPTKKLLKTIPNFFDPKFYGQRAIVSGKLSKCPSQHGYVAQGIASKAGIVIRTDEYKSLWYLQINSIKPITKSSGASVSLLGSPWAVTESTANQYLVQYGYISDDSEKTSCIEKIIHAKAWNKAKVFYDDIESPSKDLSFKRKFIL